MAIKTLDTASCSDNIGTGFGTDRISLFITGTVL